MVIEDEKIQNPVLKLVGEEADKLQLDCYVIGGWVRDLFLHRPSTDIDIVVVGKSEEGRVKREEVREKSEERRTEEGRSEEGVKIGILLAERVAHRLGRRAHLSVFKNYGTAQVKKDDLELEFVGARKESYSHDSRNPIVENGTLEEDQDRRDFTINAMAICLNSLRYGELLDPFGGMEDLVECTIRTPLDADITFSDDPLRMMRAIRFASQLGFYLDRETFEAIERNAKRIEIITRERIVEELNKILLSRRPSVGLSLLDKTGLLPLVLPDIAKLKGIETKEGKGHKDVFLHTLQVVDNVSMKSDNLWLRWSALLHDIGKPKSKQWDEQVGWTFRNHNYIGAKMVPRIFKQMKMPQNEKMDYVVKMVDLHMRPINLIEDTVTDSAIRRLLYEAGEDIEDLMVLCDADITSRQADKVERFHKNYQLVRQKMVELEERDRIRNFQPPVKGDEIMEVLHLSPCSAVGQLKQKIKDAILDGIIPNEHNSAYQYMLEQAKQMGLIE